MASKRPKFTMQHYEDIAIRYGVKGPGGSGYAECAYCDQDATIYWRTPEEVQAIRKRWGIRKLRPNHVISFGGLFIDHIIPWSQGGPHASENLTLNCSHCSASKGARTVEEWLGSSRLSQDRVR